jgi:hypothetical protein
MTEAEELFHWLDSLGFPDLASSRFVKVTERGRAVHGFLSSDQGSGFQVFLVDSFCTRSNTRTPPGTAPLQAVCHEKADLLAEVGRWLEERAPAFDISSGWVKDNPQHVGWRLREGVAQAWACDRQGQPELARQILALVGQLHDEHQRHHGSQSLRQSISDEIAHLLMWQTIEAFGDLSVSRRELLVRFENILEKFPVPPGSEPGGDERFGPRVGSHARHAQEAVTLLRKMIAEEEQARPFAAGNLDAQVAELIFQLRDQNGRQFSDPGSCSIFADERGEQSPAHQLIQLGVQAVPQLIDALDDDRFTRSVGHHRSYYFSHHVLRVGDCALAIIEQIAGRSFWRGTYTNAAMVKDGQAAQTRQKILAWWRAQQDQGEQQQLVDAVATGDENSVQQAARLIERYPTVTLPAIQLGAERTSNASCRAALVHLAGRLDEPAAIAWLREQLLAGWLTSRVAAARALWCRGYADVLTVMLHEWHQLPSHPEWLNGPASLDQEGIAAWNQVCGGPFDLMNFLVGCQRSEAIRALGAQLSRLPVDHRLHAIQILDESSFLSFSWGEVQWGRPPDPPETAEAVDELLVQCLDDTEVRSGMGGTWLGKTIHDPRLCDLAGHLLSRRKKLPPSPPPP